jgi:hypothetical protein
MKLLGFDQFIGEAGIFSGDLTMMSIKALEKAKHTRAYKILEFIFESGESGVRYTDITKFIVEKLKGEKYDHRIHRGHWATNLLGSGYRQSSRGLLYLYCQKTESGRWKLNPETRQFFDEERELYSKLSDKSRDFLSALDKRG